MDQALERLASAVAHDLNNDLQGIRGFAELLLQQDPGGSARRSVEMILAAVDRCAALTTHLEDYSRKDDVDSAPVDLRDLVTSTVAAIRPPPDAGITIRQRLHADDLKLQGDVRVLQGALTAVALNALEAMPDGGELTITSRVEALDRAACERTHHALSPGQFLVINLRDTGRGMDQDLLERAFDPFFSTNPDRRGAGMGLALARAAALRHGGTITLTSSPAMGTAAQVYLPLGPSPTAQAPETPAAPSPPRRSAVAPGGLHVLHVEDDEYALDIAARMLDRLGHRVTAVEDGEQAVAIYREGWRDIDMVLLDRSLPGLDGPEAFRQMHAINPEIRAVFCTGWDPGRFVANLPDGARVAALSKPFTRADLVAALDRAWRLGSQE